MIARRMTTPVTNTWLGCRHAKGCWYRNRAHVCERRCTDESEDAISRLIEHYIEIILVRQSRPAISPTAGFGAGGRPSQAAATITPRAADCCRPPMHAVREHRCPRPERGLGNAAVVRDQVGGKDAVGDEPLAFAVEARTTAWASGRSSSSSAPSATPPRWGTQWSRPYGRLWVAMRAASPGEPGRTPAPSVRPDQMGAKPGRDSFFEPAGPAFISAEVSSRLSGGLLVHADGHDVVVADRADGS
jgi:hypothetical protein